MAVKSIWASSTLSVYVTGHDILTMLNGLPVSAQIRVGTVDLPGLEVYSTLNGNALRELPEIVAMERKMYGNTPLRRIDGLWTFDKPRRKRDNG